MNSTLNFNQLYSRVDENQELAIKLLQSYYLSRINSGKVFDDCPDFFLIRAGVLNGVKIASRTPDKLILEDCLQRALDRQGYVAVYKRYNPKLKYYWLELGVSPFVLGDSVNENNKSEFFYVLSHFIQYTKANPDVYGDVTAEIDSDKDLALMLKEINKMGENLRALLHEYQLSMLVTFNPNWPVKEVNKIMMALKGNEQSWCEVFAEYLIYVMGRKSRV